MYDSNGKSRWLVDTKLIIIPSLNGMLLAPMMPPGYTYLKNFKDFFSKTKYWLLKPADTLVSTGYCLTNTGKEYIVYQDKPAAFQINLSAISKLLKAKWYQPFSRQYLDAGICRKGQVLFTPPAFLWDGPVVLFLSNE
ncbi:MAG: hypothetical protein H7Z13_03630 [Ferruginibacter sp.]|nr:hypothetical protein [Ferruginibacter sp.]